MSMKRRHNWIHGLAVAIGVVSTTPAAAAAPGTAEVRQVPAAWLAYAGLVQQALADWLAAPGEPAAMVRGYVHAAAAPGQPPAPIDLKVWVDRNGLIIRIDFQGFPHEDANRALGEAVVGRSIGQAPPLDMPLPLAIRVTLKARDA